MDRFNYHHLLYFWCIAREGSIVAACKKLRLAQPTLSGQIRTFEEALGEKLFFRSGRNLVLTDIGRVVYRYADEIFSLGQELMEVLRDRPTGRPIRLVVGVDDTLPKPIVYRMLEPVYSLPEPVHLICHEGRTERLLANLAMYEVDLVLTDAPIGSASRVRAFNHLLIESGTSLFAAPSVASAYAERFPLSLNGAPFLLPTSATSLRRALDQWFNAEGVRPLVVGEFEDSALLKVFGQYGAGVFAAPTVIGEEIQQQYQVSLLGHLGSVRERFYAISVERKLGHPAVAAIVACAQDGVQESQ
jgi:LysR family transcriptional regulator, transcriptional activator of nhaA